LLEEALLSRKRGRIQAQRKRTGEGKSKKAEQSSCILAHNPLSFWIEWSWFLYYWRFFQMRSIALGAFALALVAVTGAGAGELKSGPQKGSNKIPAFNPTHCNGTFTDKAVCLV
jgi:hypothetical protein